MQDLMILSSEEIKKSFENGSMTVAVAGLGWMGLSLASLYAESGAHVIGIDKNPRIIAAVNKSECPLNEPGLTSLLKRNVKEGRFSATIDAEDAASRSAVIFITVPTSIDENKKADYSAIENVVKKISLKLNDGACVIMESTCAPGVTDNLVKPILEKYSGLKAETDFGLAYSPIRAMIGRVLTDVRDYPKIVGGIGPKSLKVATSIVEVISKGGIIKVANTKTAEAAKIFETVYRDVNIALANEFASFCESVGIDYLEAADAANTQPYSHLHRPSIGVGGHCIPIYPYLLLTEARSLRVKMALVNDARKLNEDMPRHTLKLIHDSLRKINRSIIRSKITILGISYRANVKETRNSPTFELIKLLNRRGARVTVYDPMFKISEIAAMGYKSQPSLKIALEGAHCAVITVPHDEFKHVGIKTFSTTMKSPAAIVDGSGIFNPEDVEKNRLIYRGIGRGIWTK